MTVEFLKMIGHGTSGSDGIEPGIHLRWGFNDKLGFPTCFELYRRHSKPKNLHDLSIDNGMTLEVPYQQDDNGFLFTLESIIIGGREVPLIRTKVITLANGRRVPVIALDGALQFSFSEPVSQIQLELVIDNQADYEVVAATAAEEYRPLSVLGTSTGLQTLAFDAPKTTRLICAVPALPSISCEFGFAPQAETGCRLKKIAAAVCPFIRNGQVTQRTYIRF
ncbi:MAG: hypothetical protein ABL925_14955 [Methylococcales bacterium]